MKQVKEALRLMAKTGETGVAIARSAVGIMGVAAVGAVEFITSSDRANVLEEEFQHKRQRQQRDERSTEIRMALGETIGAALDRNGNIKFDHYDASGWRDVVHKAAAILLLENMDEDSVTAIIVRSTGNVPGPRVLTSADIPAEDPAAMERLGVGHGGYKLSSERTMVDSGLPYRGSEETEVLLGHS